jgi:hypothetical protein
MAANSGTGQLRRSIAAVGFTSPPRFHWQIIAIELRTHGGQIRAGRCAFRGADQIGLHRMSAGVGLLEVGGLPTATRCLRAVGALLRLRW